MMDSFKHASGEIWNGDCLELMKLIPNESIDMILCDLPYGTTACKWDSIIPFEPLWEAYKRIIKPRGAIVLTAAQPFTSALVMSNIQMFKYCWYWVKNRPVNFLNAKKQPMKNIEDILIFSAGVTTYFPQGLISRTKINKRGKSTETNNKHGLQNISHFTNYPKQSLEFSHDVGGIHPTQKPVALFEYLIRTYTNEGAVVLDNCSGSGTTAVAAHRTGRWSLCIEKDLSYYIASCGRVWGEQNA